MVFALAGNSTMTTFMNGSLAKVHRQRCVRNQRLKVSARHEVAGMTLDAGRRVPVRAAGWRPRRLTIGTGGPVRQPRPGVGLRISNIRSRRGIVVLPRPAWALPAVASGGNARSRVGRLGGTKGAPCSSGPSWATTSAAFSVKVAPLRSRSLRAAAARVERRARHGEDFAALFERESGGDQRARFRRRLDHDHAQRHPGDDAVAAREMPRLRLGAERQFGDDRPLRAPAPRRARDSLRDRRRRRRRRRRRSMPVSSAPDAPRRRCRAPGRRRRRCRPRPSPAAMSRAKRRPLAEALRAPTTATIGAAQQLRLPEHGQHGGASSTAASALGISRLAPADERAPRGARARRTRLALGPRDRRSRILERSPAPREPRQRVERRARPSRSGAAARKR